MEHPNRPEQQTDAAPLSGVASVARAKRDLTEDQFVAKIEKLGGKKSFMGYVEFRWDDGSKHGGNVSINRYNAGERRRDQLRYLTRELKKHIASERAK